MPGLRLSGGPGPSLSLTTLCERGRQRARGDRLWSDQFAEAESQRLAPARLATGPLAHRKSATSASRCHGWREDACQVRISGAPEALAALNGAVLALMDWLQVLNVASHMRHFCAHPLETL